MIPNSGDWPIRYRGYYRALKKGKTWAVELSKLPPIQHLLRWEYRSHHLEAVICAKNPFFAMIEKQEEFSGKYHPVPIILGKNNE